MIKYLVLTSTDQLNYFLAKGGISDTLSPIIILGKGNLNYNKHCKYPFGAYIQAHDETYEKNTQHARTLDTIYLQPLGNIQGGHMVLDIATGQPITRRSITEVPIPQPIISRVEQLAANDGIRHSKFKGKDINIYDTDWIAGVDNQNNNKQT